MAYASRPGDEIKVYSTGRNIRPVIDHLNSLVASESLRIRIVDVESDSDVSIKFEDDLGYSNAVGLAYPFCGKIYITNLVPPDQIYVVLMHEILHCAGVGHEPEDPSSIMYTHSQRQGQLKKWHTQYLRRLAGITIPGRIVAQIRAML
jgi:hypothetical protein